MNIRIKIILGLALLAIVFAVYLVIVQNKLRETDLRNAEKLCEISPLDYAVTAPEKRKTSLAEAKELLSRIQYNSNVSERLNSWIATAKDYQEKANQAAQNLSELQIALQYHFPEEEKVQLTPAKIESLLNAANKAANAGTEKIALDGTSILISEAFPERLKNLEKLAGTAKEEINGRDKRYNAFTDKLKRELSGGIDLSMKQVGLNERFQEIEGWVTYCTADPDKKQVLQDYQNNYRELVSVLKALEIVQSRLQYVEQEAKASSLSAKTWAALRKELDDIKIKLDERTKEAKKLGIMMDEIDALFSKATIELTKAESKLIAPEESKQNP